MLSQKTDWVDVVEVSPPRLPDMTHTGLIGRWGHAMVTDNAFRQVRVSPFAYAARLAHDAPAVHPTVVVSTRDRNVLAIESEVRGAIGNGVDSFLAVVGDTLPEVEHLANHYDILEHLRKLQAEIGPFEVGMSSPFKASVYRRRVEAGADFLVSNPIVDPATVEGSLAALERCAGDPPLFVGIMPPFSLRWIDVTAELGAVPVGGELRERLGVADGDTRRLAWQAAADVAARARAAGAAGCVLMGLRFKTAVGEAHEVWHR